MAKSQSETILLKGKMAVRKEAVTDEAVSPGHFVERGGTQDVQKAPLGSATPLVAIENTPIGEGIEDAYAANDTVLMVAVYPGCEILAKIAAGENIAENALLRCGASGVLQDAGATADNARAIALEAVNNTSGTTETFIRVEVI